MKNNSVTLVKFDSKYATKYSYPLSIVTIGSALKRAGFDVELIHCCDDDLEGLVKKVLEKKPLFVGFSVITSASIKPTAEVSRTIKEKSKIPVVWGGIHPTLLPEQCISEDYIDIITLGEGEETAIELAQRLRDGKSLKGLKGVWYKDKGKVVKESRREYIKDFSDYRIDFTLLNPEDYYHELHGSPKGFDYMASRGCPHHCGFCYNAVFNKRTWRPISEKFVIEDIEYLKKNHGVDAVYFLDDNFYVDKKRALSILEKVNLPTYTEIRIDYIDENFIRKLKEVDPKLILVGAESGSDRILKLIGKGFTVEEMKEGVKLFAKYHIPAHYSFILGLPTETKEETGESIDLMLWIHKNHPEALFTVGQYMPYPGSDLYDFAVKCGFKEPKDTEDWHRIDRFKHTFELPWIDQKLTYFVREYFFFFSTRIKIIQKVCALRLKYRFFLFPVDLWVLHFLYNTIKHKDNIITKAGKKLIRILQKV